MKLSTLPLTLAGLVTAMGCTEQDWPTATVGDVGPPALAKKGVPNAVPFKVTLLIAANPPVPPFPQGCEVFFTTSVSGNATHLGRIEGAGATCGFNGRVVNVPPFLPAGGPPYFVSDFTNEMTWTAANGDQLEFSVTAPPAVFVQSLANGAARSEGQGDLVGGTGRFEGAVGQIDVVAVDDGFGAEGWIRYDASQRSR